MLVTSLGDDKWQLEKFVWNSGRGPHGRSTFVSHQHVNDIIVMGLAGNTRESDTRPEKRVKDSP